METMGLKFKKMESMATVTKTAQAWYRFEVAGYASRQGVGVGNFIRSDTFSIGGFDWAIRFYPAGKSPPFADYVSVHIEFMTWNATALASYEIGLVNHAAGSAKTICLETTPREFRSCDHSRLGPRTPAFILRSTMEERFPGYIADDDCLTIWCSLTVVRHHHRVCKSSWGKRIQVPPSGLSENFISLFLDGEEPDVRLSVGGETFPAHKRVLAARSPVFKAEMYGQMKETTAQCVTIEDMQPEVFRAMLHFIYSDSLPSLDDLEGDDYVEMARHLLVAADRYAMDRLKLLCANILADHLDVENWATLLVLADRHNFDSLKDVCIEFAAPSGKMDAIATTLGYANIEKTYPCVLEDALEKISQYREI